jgi:hypothetical protein
VRLQEEDTLCRDLMSDRLREWLKQKQTDEARHWGVLTHVGPRDLKVYAATFWA